MKKSLSVVWCLPKSYNSGIQNMYFFLRLDFIIAFDMVWNIWKLTHERDMAAQITNSKQVEIIKNVSMTKLIMYVI